MKRKATLARPLRTSAAEAQPGGGGQSRFIRIADLSKSYQEGSQTRVILRQIDVAFDRGQSAAILGKSGSGKSTLLNLISGIDRPDSGSIWLGGTALTSLTDHEFTLFRRRNIGFIFQFFNLIPTLTVRENVLLPAELEGRDKTISGERASSLLDMVGLTGRDKAFPDQLSGGEQQRVAIARALIHDPMLLLADEPTGNLDEETGTQILKLIDRLTRQAGKNLVMVTHSRDAAAYADRVFSLHEGRLHEDGASSY
jgi:putative ABC transport system ATP-binding protein